MNKKISHNSGITLVETLLYAIGVSLILAVLSFSIYQMYRFYHDLTIIPRVDRVGVTLVDRIIKDMRTGQTVNLSESELNTAVGSITIDALENNVQVEKFFDLDLGTIYYQEDGGALEEVTPDDMSVSRFYFTQVNSPVSEAIRVELDITFTRSGQTQTRSFSGLAILRHTYE